MPTSAPNEHTSAVMAVRETAIEGRFRRITTHQLCMAWWCHTAGHITRRQLRVWFAAHEMHERRRYMAQEGRGSSARAKVGRKPLYALEELKSLVGGRGSPTADAELAADLRQLARLNLVRVEDHAISFAMSADQLTVADLTGFWAMFAQIPNPGRTVPVPRRTLRALAGGFSRAVTGVMIALMIRSLFWHRDTEDYRVDGRTKGSWIADVFGLSRRAVTDARAHLFALGWLEPIGARQWELNRWGAHDRIHVEWSPNAAAAIEAVGEGGLSDAVPGDFASPAVEIPAEFASPCLNTSPFPSEKNLKTISPDPRSDPAGFEIHSEQEKHKPKPLERAVGKEGVSLRNMQAGHLQSTACLILLFYQAVAARLIVDNEAGQLDFFALAERASSRGHNPGGLFRWLLQNKRFEFITLADEDAAQMRLRALQQGADDRRQQGRGERPVPPPPETEQDRMVQACLAVAERRGIADAFVVLKTVKPDWTREQWDHAVDAAEAARMRRLNHQRDATDWQDGRNDRL